MTSNDQLHDVLDDAQTFYRRSVHGSWVFRYLFKRQIADAIAAGQLGYAPKGHAQTFDYLTRRGHGPQAILDAGLAAVPAETKSPVRDVMRDRLTFPVHDADGRVIGFLGRAAPEAPDYVPKYLNTPTTALYNKSESLYGLVDEAGRIAAGTPPILVEGPLDRWALHHAGDRIPQVAPIAPCGTAITSEHLQSLANLTNGPLLVALDGDEAGRSAALRLWDTARAAIPQRSIHLVQLPHGSDPAQLVQRGRYSTLAAAIGDAQPLAQVALDVALGRTPGTNPIHATAITSAIARRDVPALSPGDRGAYVAHVAQRLRLTGAQATALVADAVANSPPADSRAESPRAVAGETARPVVRRLSAKRHAAAASRDSRCSY